MKPHYKKPLLFILDSFTGHKKVFYLYLFGKVIEGLFYVGLPVLAKLEMDQLVEQNKQLFGIIELSSFNIFLVILVIIFAVRFIQNFLQSFIDLFQNDALTLYDNYLKLSLYDRLKNVEPGVFFSGRNKRFIREILGYSTSISRTIRDFGGELVTNIFMLIGIFTVLSLLNIWIFVVLLASSVVIYFIEKVRARIQEKNEFEEKYEYEHKIWIASDQMAYSFSELLSSGGFLSVLRDFGDYNEELRKRIHGRQKYEVLLSLLGFFIENIGEVAVKVIVGMSIFFSGASIGTMTMTIMYIGNINRIFEFARSFRFSFDRFLDNLKKLSLFLELTENKKEKTKRDDAIKSIVFKNVTFSYPNFAEHELKYLEIIENRIKSYKSLQSYHEDELHMVAEAKKELAIPRPIILSGLDIAFEKGKTYGLIGKNGAGKSTIIALLQNFFDAFSGDILINGEDIRHYARSFFESHIAIISQVPYIVGGFTLRENLLLGVEKYYSDAEIFALLDEFGLTQKIQKLRKGLDSELAYDSDFSGGEKQLIALCRVILQDKQVLIMDEGTNQLDAENEQKVMERLLKNKEGKIVIFITHRMTSIKNADKIYCLQNGKITASGTHRELLQGNNIYNDFWKKQVG